MRCSKCNFNNRIKAIYCKECGYKFSKAEKDVAYNKTFIGRYKQYKKWYDRFSLNFIFDSIIFKVLSILIILAVGIYYLYTNGINIKLLNSDNYDIIYNEKINEYYLIVDAALEEVPINLYIPNRTKEIVIYHLDLDGNNINKFSYNQKDDLILETYNNDYYSIQVTYSNNSTEKIKLYLYNESNIKK